MIKALFAGVAALSIAAVANASADLIAVEGGPLVDPTAMQRVDYVMVLGHPIQMKGQ